MSFLPGMTSSPVVTRYGGFVTSSTTTSSGVSSGGSGASAVVSPPGSTVGYTDTKSADSNSLASQASYQSTPDPVAKAVVDNIMGKLPTKKPQVSVRCDLCDLEFSAQIVLDTHLAGSKHSKKMKSLEILSSLEKKGQSFVKDSATSSLRCDVCEVVVNSSQQLATHLSGNKHLSRAAKRSVPDGESGKESSKKALKIAMMGFVPAADTASSSNGSSSVQATAQSTSGPLSSGTMASAEASSSANGNVKHYFCATCKISPNSAIQLEQHLGSKKHKDKVSGVHKPNKKNWNYPFQQSQSYPPYEKSQSYQPPYGKSQSYQPPYGKSQSYQPYGNSMYNNYY